MKMRKKSMALILSVALVITMIPAGASFVYADEGSSPAKSAGGDAFSAIGIDTSVAPDGYDADSIDNPYGRDTIKVNTVSELYTVRLNQDVSKINDDRIDAGESSESAKGEPSIVQKGLSASLNATLYGDGSVLKTTTEALGEISTGAISSGDLNATGNYVKLNFGTHSYTPGAEGARRYIR